MAKANVPLANCQATEIQNELLEALLTNKIGGADYQHINPLIAGGHGRCDKSRHVLSYLMRKALGVIRQPGTYDIKLQSEHFKDFTLSELESAEKEILRIYQHTQHELTKHNNSNKIRLMRGISGLEAAVVAKLLEEVDGPEIHFFFQTITFFNHGFRPFSRQIEVVLEAPLDWVWANAYTLNNLDLPGDDDEFIVICKSADGLCAVPKTNFKITPHLHPIEKVVSPDFGCVKQSPRGLHIALSALMQEGFEPDNWTREIAKYNPGRWEQKLAKLGAWIDSRGNKFWSNRVNLVTKSAH